MRKTSVMCVVAVAGLAAPSMAQDSVGIGNGLAGNDALNTGLAGAPYQRAQYVVDLVPLFGSWGTRFAVAPIIKSGSTAGNYRDTSTGGDINRQFFNAQISSQAISQTLRLDAPFAAGAYQYWNDRDNVQGRGINPEANANPQTITPTGSSTQFGVAFADFGGNVNRVNLNSVVGGIVNFDPAEPTRLYVTRVQAANNASLAAGGAPATVDTAQFGLGAVDAIGNVYFRADDFGTANPNRILEDNYFRTRLESYAAFNGRDPSTVNVITNAGAADAPSSDWLVVRSTTTHNTPNGVPAELASVNRGIVIGSNFGRNYVYGPLGGIATSAGHRTPAADHRGNVAFTKQILRGGTSIGTAAMMTQSLTGNGAPKDRINVWGVKPDGGEENVISLLLPRGVGATIDDTCDLRAWDLGEGDFHHHTGATAFRGGNGQVALGRDQAGRGLVAAAVSGNQSLTALPPLVPTDDSPHTGIAVARFDTANPAAVEWRMAAWVDPSQAFTAGGGKPIYGDNGADGIPFTGDAGEFDGTVDATPIGRLASLFEVTGGNPLGPSMSAPGFDSVGNIYFLSAVALKKSFGEDFDSALIRAVYDPAAFCWRLELLMELGDTFVGANSGVRWQVQFLSIAASNSRPSPSSFWSGNISQNAFNGIDPADLDTRDAATLGGLVLQASIVYDRDNDGDFENPTATGGNPASADQQYNALLYIGNRDPVSVGCPADFNGDGFVDFFDFDDFVSCFEGIACPPGNSADFNGDGFVDFFDYDDFVLAFENGCP